jgi:hypothetical protein
MIQRLRFRNKLKTREVFLLRLCGLFILLQKAALALIEEVIRQIAQVAAVGSAEGKESSNQPRYQNKGDVPSSYIQETLLHWELALKRCDGCNDSPSPDFAAGKAGRQKECTNCRITAGRTQEVKRTTSLMKPPRS